MAEDPFQDLLSLEDGFYSEGHALGMTDGAYAGHIEGKVFGIEKGYEKALELAKLHGRALVWNTRLTNHISCTSESAATTDEMFEVRPLPEMSAQLETLGGSARLQKHVETLLALTDPKTIRADNSDDAVSEFDERLAKARVKAKVIASIVGETIGSVTESNGSGSGSAGIEDATGLNARH